MKPLTKLETWACPLPLSNIDTDQLIPARFMKTPRYQGYQDYLLYDLRRNDLGELRSDWALNHDAGKSAQVLVTRKNFGAGSSREAAVYALVDHGFRCVIAPSMGDIFSSNAVNNGLLPAVVSDEDAEKLLSALMPNGCLVTVDLPAQRIHAGDLIVDFHIKPNWKVKLINGWDDIDLTLSLKSEIQTFKTQRLQTRSWLFPPISATH